MFAEILTDGFHPLKSGRNLASFAPTLTSPSVSIPSSRVGTDDGERSILLLPRFPSPQVGSELLAGGWKRALLRVSIPSSRVGT